MSVFGSLGADHTLVPSDVGASIAGLAIFGDGSDGTVTISVDTTLSANKTYDTLTINNGVTLLTGGWQICVKNTLTNNGTISCAGAAPSPSAFQQGAGGAGDYYDGGQSGVAATTGAGTASGFLAISIGGSSGAGGHGTSGNGGVTNNTGTNVNYGSYRSLWVALTGAMGPTPIATPAAFPAGGAGGGSGAGDGTNKGGGGGGGGGVMGIIAKTIVNSGTITAAGGVGGAATAGNCGGGGGGGGGAIYLVYNTLTNSGTITVAGGGGGAKTGTGVAGSAGSTGNIIQIPNT